MNELLQKHGCSNVFTIPEGLRELMSDITREVLRAQPEKIFDFIANYLSALLITREHGIMAVKILEDLCDCRPSVSEHLLQLGMDRAEAVGISEVVKEVIEAPGAQPKEGVEKVKEMDILKQILTRFHLDEEMTAKVTQVARNAYRDYWYRKLLLEKSLKPDPEEPWEIAAQHTLNIYKKTKPSFDELNRATQKIQAAYQGYHVRRNLLRHLKPKPKPGPKIDLPGPPVDVAESREIDLGRVIDIKVKDDNVGVLFEADVSDKLGLGYDPMRTITHVQEEVYDTSSRPSRVRSTDRSQTRPSVTLPASRSQTGAVQKEFSETSSAAGRESRAPSQAPGLSLSFAEEPPKVITVEPDVEDVATKISIHDMQQDAEVKDGGEEQKVEETQEGQEIQAQKSQEAQQVEEVLEGQVAQEVPEEVPQEVQELPEAQEAQEVPEAQEAQEVPESQAAQEVQEVIQTEAPEAAQEVPEDISAAEDRTEGDGASAPVSSATATTAGDTAEATDVEDTADLNTTGEEEGE